MMRSLLGIFDSNIPNKISEGTKGNIFLLKYEDNSKCRACGEDDETRMPSVCKYQFPISW